MATKRSKKALAPAEPTSEGNRTAGINLPADLWELLIDVSVKRKKTRGGRASVSAIIVELIQRHRSDLEGELK